MLSLLLLSVPVLTVSAQHYDEVEMKGFTIDKGKKGDSVRIGFTLSVPGKILKSNEELVLIPLLMGVREEKMFHCLPTRVMGNIRMKSMSRRRLFHPEALGDTLKAYIGNKQWCGVEYEVWLPNEPWIWKSKLVLLRQLHNCCSIKELKAMTLHAWDLKEEYKIPVLAHQPDPAPVEADALPHKSLTEMLAETEHFVEPISNYVAGRKITSGEQERAQIVYFKLSKAEIDNTYRNNEKTLDHIINITRQISEDPEVEIAHIVLLGLSSPEGTFAFNKQLAGERAESLKRYITNRIALPDSCFELVNGDEGWGELRYLVERSQMAAREEVLKIIDTVPIFKGRETRLMCLRQGMPYQYMRRHFFPQIRRAGYIKVYYRMRTSMK